MDEKMRQEIALHRWAVIAEAANTRLTSSERGAVVRVIAAREHAHPDGTMRRYSRGTIDRWLRAWRAAEAKAQHVPPYVIFHDRTLAEIATVKPGSRAALERINGVGEGKLARYGAAVLEVVGGFDG